MKKLWNRNNELEREATCDDTGGESCIRQVKEILIKTLVIIACFYAIVFADGAVKNYLKQQSLKEVESMCEIEVDYLEGGSALGRILCGSNTRTIACPECGREWIVTDTSRILHETGASGDEVRDDTDDRYCMHTIGVDSEDGGRYLVEAMPAGVAMSEPEN